MVYFTSFLYLRCFVFCGNINYMNIVVIVSQTPDTTTKVVVSADQKSIDESGITWILNPYAEFAIEKALKLKEGKKSVLQGVPKGLPALIKAQRMQEKAAGVGFDWPNKAEVWAKFEEELEELKQAEESNNLLAVEEEFGDLFFSLINYARFLKINPETALEKTNIKFKKRFEYIEKKATESNTELTNMSLPQMEKYWIEAKNQS